MTALGAVLGCVNAGEWMLWEYSSAVDWGLGSFFVHKLGMAVQSTNGEKEKESERARASSVRDLPFLAMLSLGASMLGNGCSGNILPQSSSPSPPQAIVVRVAPTNDPDWIHMPRGFHKHGHGT
jgi:hypothetical protein